MANVVECNGLTKFYDNFCALKDVNLQIPENVGIVGLLGPNGSGKTTLIKLLTGLLTPTSGEALVAGKEIGVETKAMVSYLSDAHSLNNDYTVMQQLEYFEDFFLDFDKAKALQMIRELGVNETKKIKTLSKGTKEKVQLVLVMSRRARLYLLDEPIGGVDPATRDYILETILASHSPDSTILISTHLIADIEQVLEEFIFIQHGRLLRYGSVAEVHEDEGRTVDSLFREVFRC